MAYDYMRHRGRDEDDVNDDADGEWCPEAIARQAAQDDEEEREGAAAIAAVTVRVEGQCDFCGAIRAVRYVSIAERACPWCEHALREEEEDRRA